MSEAPEEERRSLLAKFRYASLFQGLLIVLVALVAFVPTLGALARQAEARRRAASREVIESGVNSMARFVAMELGRDFLPRLWSQAERAADGGSELAHERFLEQEQEISERIAEKMSYNSVLVDLIVVVPHPDPSHADRAIVLPVGQMDVPDVSSQEARNTLQQIKQLTRLETNDRWAPTALGRYLLEQANQPGYEAFVMPIRREGIPYGYAGLVVNTNLITEQFESQWFVFWRGLQQSLLLLGIVSLLALAGGAVFILVLAGRLIRPLEDIRAALDTVRTSGDGTINPQDLRSAGARLARVEVDSGDEVGALRNSFLQLSDNLADVLAQKADALVRLKESTQQLQRADRLKLVGTLTYGLAHNLNNALAPIANLAHAATWRHPDDQKLNEMMSLVLSNVERSSDIVRRLRDLTRVSSGETVPVSVNSVLEESLEIVRRTMADNKIQIVREFGELPEIRGNPVELWEVFTNLLVNAAEALGRMPADHSRRIVVRSLPRGENVAVEIEDNGPGMSEAVKAKAFEPWFSTKPDREASGIGLWITRRVVEEHGGRLELETREGSGTTVRVTFPILRPLESKDEQAAVEPTEQRHA